MCSKKALEHDKIVAFPQQSLFDPLMVFSKSKMRPRIHATAAALRGVRESFTEQRQFAEKCVALPDLEKAISTLLGIVVIRCQAQYNDCGGNYVPKQ